MWRVEVRGTIGAIATRGSMGQVLVLAEDADGYGLVERRDGYNGELLGTSRLPDADGDLVVADNGSTVGTVRDLEVHFYALDVELPVHVVDPTPPDCIVPMDRAPNFLD